MRIDNWESALNKYIDKMSRVPFEWGKTDCCAMAGNWVDIALNSNVNNYKCSNAKEAAKIIAENGGVSGIADKHLERIDIKQAKRGDIIQSYEDKKRAALGICMGEFSVFKSKNSILRIKTLDCIAAWGVN